MKKLSILFVFLTLCFGAVQTFAQQVEDKAFHKAYVQKGQNFYRVLTVGYLEYNFNGQNWTDTSSKKSAKK